MDTSRKATTLNAVATFSSGIAIVLFSKQLASIFEISSTTPFWVVGGVIAFFSLTMVVEIKKQRALALLWIIAQDLMFTLASVFVLIVRPFEISDTGYWFIGLFLIPIIFFIVYQSIGLSRIDAKKGTNSKLMSFKRSMNAPKSKVWEAISDVGNYHKVAPNIEGSEILSGEKVGMVRACSHGKDSWTETCSLWEEEKEYSFEVDTTAPDYPFPFKTLRGNWQVREVGKGETEITMNFEFEYTKSFHKLLLHPVMKYQFTKICKELLDNWQRMVEEK
jgi:ribosome-associated toxin RatA of RatAB toxin-antitoxin module